MTPIERFIVNLAAAFSKRITPETAAIYYQKLGKWNLTEEQWAMALSRIIGDCSEFPKINEVYRFLAGVNPRKPRECRNPVMQLFDRDGKRYGRAVTDPQESFPWDSTERRIAIPPDLSAHEEPPQLTTAEKRAAFRHGWAASGADPSKCDVLFGMVDGIMRRPDLKRSSELESIAELIGPAREPGDESMEIPF